MMRALLRLWQRKLCPNPVLGDCPPTAPITFPISVYSHRGGFLEEDPSGRPFVENTLSAFRNSARLGVDVLELDVHLTKDGHVVVFHDKNMGRMCGRAGKGKSIAEFNLDDLPPLLDNYSDSKANKVEAATVPEERDQDRDRTRIPRLEELFIEFPTIPIQIDFKADSEKLVRLTHELIMRHPERQQLLIWGSFLHEINSCAYKLDPSIPLSASMFRMLLLMLAHRFGMMKEFPVYESFFIAPWSWLGNWIGRTLHFRRWIETLGKTPGVAIVLFGGASINNRDAFAVCRSTICHAICTDTPSLLQQFLADVGPLPLVITAKQ